MFCFWYCIIWIAVLCFHYIHTEIISCLTLYQEGNLFKCIIYSTFLCDMLSINRRFGNWLLFRHQKEWYITAEGTRCSNVYTRIGARRSVQQQFYRTRRWFVSICHMYVFRNVKIIHHQIMRCSGCHSCFMFLENIKILTVVGKFNSDLYQPNTMGN
jgi:hypothetical protein